METEIRKQYGNLVREYKELCFSLGRDDEAGNIPDTRDELVNEIKELNFEWLHEFHIG